MSTKNCGFAIAGGEPVDLGLDSCVDKLVVIEQRQGVDLGGLLGPVLAAMPDGLELQAERPKESRDLLYIANAFVGEAALGVFLFGPRLSVLNKVNAHINP